MRDKIPLAHPIVPHRNATMKENSGLDPYNKGAYVLHMLRYLIGGDALAGILKEFLSMEKKLPHNQVTTQDFIDLVHLRTSMDLNWFFKVYLYETALPVLNKNISHGSNHTFIEFHWENPDFKMPLEVKYSSNTGPRTKKLSLTNNPVIIPVAQYSDVKIDPMNWILLTISDPQ
jgi:aminopeptidase N